MKSVAFLRNTWKKWEQKTFEKDDSHSNTRRESQIPATHSRSSGRSLVLTVKRQPLEDTTASVVQGTWRPSKASQPSSPVSDEFYCRGCSLRRRAAIFKRQQRLDSTQKIVHGRFSTNTRTDFSNASTTGLLPSLPATSDAAFVATHIAIR
ncbi:hypothetical protein NLJ89_g7651 [Agrocybe chaxingu]|uniref:Uncharacterized protein n=1 Tax=Agrocybe chaxingu TaxID=84603 RepID=A0A9W8JYS7_9AGAR|nr:hypothetical protein NLJ89_g7651 [Agrocybe chaxingu]